MRQRPNDVTPTYCHGYWHGRNNFERAAHGGDYVRGYRDGLAALAAAPPPPHSENETLTERTDA